MSTSKYVPPVETFQSSMDLVFSDDEDDIDEQVPVALPTVSSVAETSIKGRNTPATLPRPGARASKTNALAALNTSVQKSATPAGSKADESDRASPAAASSTAATDSSSTTGPKTNPARRAAKLAKSPPLDFSTIRTHVPRFPNPLPRPKSRPTRIFGIPEAPVYHPSVEEFAHPMEYIEKIAVEAKEYGICKIVPPEGWRPPFALDSETFRFKTRLQQLNSMEASARASLNFLEQLYLFHRQQGNSGISIPTIGTKPVDMWKLKREVSNLGGYATVTNERKWTTVGKQMGYNVTVNTTVCSQLKTAYLKIVVPFEDYVKRVNLAGGVPPPDPTILNDDVPVLDELATKLNATPKASNGAESLATPGSDAGGSAGPVGGANDKVRTASDKLNEAIELDNKGAASVTKLAGLLPSRDVKKPAYDDTPGEVCEICTKDHDPHKIVLCDGCDRGYHLNCLSPPLQEVPTSQFFCDTCLFLNGADYGFDEGEEHSLHSFRRRADAFKRKWLQEHPMPLDKGKGRAMDIESAEDELDEQLAIEDHFEREFWRLVESQHETVEVEYGADVNSTKDGGGFPNLEVHPQDPYSRDGWNLNNLPILAGSLLRYIKSDISGMTIPWIYVGMVFSTFAWHKEDHYTYSINYHHWGDTKTWYGIPGADDEKLEAAMKLAAPELFDQQPDLMFQLVTLMSPGRLKKHGVRVVACDQRPNEFIITFPRGYHSGFNHGFNFNEAVNFALPGWLPTGLKCVNRYRDIKKNPVFSHDELLVTIAQYEKSPRNSRWLLPNYKEMVDRELVSRARIRRVLPNAEEDVDSTELDEEDYQCGTCRVLCFLSQIVVEVGEEYKISCLDHYSSLPEGTKHFRLRYSDDELKAMLAKVKARSDKAGRVSEGPIGFGDLGAGSTGRKRKTSSAAADPSAAEFASPSLAQRPKVIDDVSSDDSAAVAASLMGAHQSTTWATTSHPAAAAPVH
ncbi:JmjC domain, hydroxylase-domain-containing protein [Leucosporidium creatinivorum]|uniref:[histone H3]-trimethyl-L-lysine(4) demethylase n=1 Tax=Leucosporidium creatinivorum TaxID=106004 RepID=A0A1Y2DHG3_9BASI|nr:JmjC domain, hydroxylase-domain-containing protein [Leucosporidium creatinivorum]